MWYVKTPLYALGTALAWVAVCGLLLMPFVLATAAVVLTLRWMGAIK